MQDAYFVDQQKIGNWNAIGYKAPASKNFTYAGGDVSGAGENWTATALFDASDCTGGNKWTITTSTVGTGTAAQIKYQASDNCSALTPNFKNIGTSGS